MVSGAVSPRLWWLRARCPILSSLSPASSRGAWQSTARAARLIFSSVPSLAPAPTSSPRTASPAPTKTCRYISARSNHLGLSQPRTQTDSKPTKRGCQPLVNRLLGVTHTHTHPQCWSIQHPQLDPAWVLQPHEQGPWKGTACPLGDRREAWGHPAGEEGMLNYTPMRYCQNKRPGCRG